MKQSRLEWKVGAFVLVGMVLLGILLIQFSKGASIFRSQYKILLTSENVSGLKNRADVLMSGVKVGSVSDITLAPSGKSVLIELTIYSRYKIHKDARFLIEQAGFLGDQYVAIWPGDNKAELFHDGDVATAQAPFNLQEVARSASDLVSRVEDTTKSVNLSLSELRRYLLNANTLTNLSLTVSNLRLVSEKAVATVDTLGGLIQTNGPTLSQTASNLSNFSTNMNTVSLALQGLVETNRGRIDSAVSNIEASTESLRSIMADLEAGKGLAGNLLQNEELSESVTQITHNLSITTSNLNRLGLWGIMWKHKDVKPPSAPAEKLSAPKDSGKL